MSEIEISKIKTDPDQPRKHFDEEGIKALADSIKRDGLLQPITVTSLDDGNYRLVIGERRLRACKLLGRESIKCLIIETKETFTLSLIENIQREDLSPIEEAEAYRKLLDSGMKQEELGKRIGKSQSQIAQKLALLKLPPRIRLFLRSRRLSEGHGRQLLKLQKDLEMFHFPDPIEFAGIDSLLDMDDAAMEKKYNPKTRKELTLVRFSYWTIYFKWSVAKLKEEIEDFYCALVYEHPIYGKYHRLVGRVKPASAVHGRINLLRAFKISLERGDRWVVDEDEEGRPIYMEEKDRLPQIQFYEKKVKELYKEIKEVT